MCRKAEERTHLWRHLRIRVRIRSGAGCGVPGLPPEALEAAGARNTKHDTMALVDTLHRCPVKQIASLAGELFGLRAMACGARTTMALRLKSMCTIRAGNLSPRLRPSSPSPSMCSGGKWYWLIVPVKTSGTRQRLRARARTLFNHNFHSCAREQSTQVRSSPWVRWRPTLLDPRQSRDARLCLNLRHDHVDWRSCRKQRVAGTRHLIEWKETRIL